MIDDVTGHREGLQRCWTGYTISLLSGRGNKSRIPLNEYVQCQNTKTPIRCDGC